MRISNIKVKKCAFCKNWYDPTNGCIRPRVPQAGTWEYDEKAMRKCLLLGYDRNADAFCKDYVCKIESQN